MEVLELKMFQLQNTLFTIGLSNGYLLAIKSIISSLLKSGSSSSIESHSEGYTSPKELINIDMLAGER